MTNKPARNDGWLDRPQRRPLRRLLFQLHLWLGIAMGVYVVVISVSGSAVVFRRDLNLWLVPRQVAVVPGARLSKNALRAAAEADYPGYSVIRIGEPQRRDRPVSIDLERAGRKRERLFDPYTGRDLGDSFPPVLGVVEWLVSLHDNLLGGGTGRSVNGIASILVTALALTGGIIWWPGRRRWRWSLAFKRGSSAPRFMWQLHSVLGFWSFALVALWAATGIYFAFPGPFEWLMNYFNTDVNAQYRPGERLLLWLIKLHFGRFGGPGVQVLWTLLGLLPAVLFVTGFTLWWRRVVRRRMGARRSAAAVPLEAIGDP